MLISYNSVLSNKKKKTLTTRVRLSFQLWKTDTYKHMIMIQQSIERKEDLHSLIRNIFLKGYKYISKNVHFKKKDQNVYSYLYNKTFVKYFKYNVFKSIYIGFFIEKKNVIIMLNNKIKNVVNFFVPYLNVIKRIKKKKIFVFSIKETEKKKNLFLNIHVNGNSLNNNSLGEVRKRVLRIKRNRKKKYWSFYKRLNNAFIRQLWSVISVQTEPIIHMVLDFKCYCTHQTVGSITSKIKYRFNSFYKKEKNIISQIKKNKKKRRIKQLKYKLIPLLHSSYELYKINKRALLKRYKNKLSILLLDNLICSNKYTPILLKKNSKKETTNINKRFNKYNFKNNIKRLKKKRKKKKNKFLKLWNRYKEVTQITAINVIFLNRLSTIYNLPKKKKNYRYA
jgi:hypothetical protein